MVGSRKARSDGDSLNGFCLIGGDEVGISTASTLQGCFRSSILVARHSAVVMSSSMSCVFCWSSSFGLISLLLFWIANCSFLARHLIPSNALRCCNLFFARNSFTSSSLISSCSLPGSSKAAPREVGELLAGIAALVEAVTCSQVA